MDFPRTRRRIRQLPLVPMIDVMFILIIFFMLTTNFMKIESMELTLPAPGTKAKSNAPVSHITLTNDGGIFFGRRPIADAELDGTLKNLLNQKTEQRVLVLVEDKVPLQTLVEVMDRVYQAGGKNVFVRALPPATPVTEGGGV